MVGSLFAATSLNVVAWVAESTTGTLTIGLLNDARYFETGSVSCTWPSSTSIIKAVDAMGLVME